MDLPGNTDTGSRARWSVGSAMDWGAVDLAAARGDAEVLLLARRAALRAARRTVGLSHLLSALAGDSIASALLARELHDSWKHFHALRSYLEVVEYSPAIGEAELDQHRRSTPEGVLKRPEDAAERIARLLDDAARDGAVFGLINSRALDPALAKLANLVARDREQHSLTLTRYLAARSVSSSEKSA